MNKSIAISVFIGLVVISAVAIFYETPSKSELKSVYDSGFTYYDIETIQKILKEHEINVSKPVAITDYTVNQYCMYFENGLPKTVDYCTTTVVIFNGKSIGNINLGGDTNSPILAIANFETPTLESYQDQVFTVFETMIETLVCDCWDEEQSDGYNSIPAWLNAAQKFYNDSEQRSVKSKIDNLGDSQIILEITSKENSVLRTLIILK